MADADVVPTNCTGETCSHIIGLDPTDLVNPNLLKVVGKYDGRTLECADGIGERVKICGENAEHPATFIGDTDSGNMLRVMQTANPEVDCGLVVAAPFIVPIATTARVALAQNPVTDDDPIPIDGPDIQTVVLTNSDTVDRLFTVKGRFSIIIEIDDPDEVSEGQFIARSALEAVGGGPTLGIGFIGGGALNSRVALFTYPPGPFGGYTLNQQFEFCDEVILPPGVSRQIRYYTSTIRTANVLTPGTAVAPFRGVNLAGVSRRSEQVRTA
jgi:hypothetical protein